MSDRRRVKGFFLALCAAALSLGALPAHAGEGGISASVTTPGNGAVVQGSVTVQASAQSDEGISEMSLSIAGATVSSSSPGRNSSSLSYVWNTNYLPGGGGSSNGDYSISVVATSSSGATTSHEIIVLVDNAPSVPSGLSASSSGDTITVRWAANPEPDITGYRVERNSGGGFQSVGTTQSTTFYDAVGDNRSHSYRVIALRRSPTAGTRSSAPSGSVTISASQASSGSSPSAGGSGGGTGGGGGGGGGGLPQLPGGGKNGGRNGGAGDFFDFASGLPSTLDLPSLAALAPLPNLPAADQYGATELDWGTYEEELPYDLSAGAPQWIGGESRNVAARAPDRIIPPDGLRWVAAGILLLMAASLLRFAAIRLGTEPAAAAYNPVPVFLRKK